MKQHGFKSAHCYHIYENCLNHSEHALTLNFKASILKGSVVVSISHFISVVGDDGIIDVILLVLRVTPFELAAKPLVPFRKPLL